MRQADDMPLEKLTGRQKRPSTGDVFRLRLTSGDYYFGLVVDGNMAVGPMASGSILVVIFSGSSTSGEIEDMDELVRRPLLMPPGIYNQRPWTTGYLERIGNTEQRPDVEYAFKDLAFEKIVDRFGEEIKSSQGGLLGVWGLGNEYTLGDDLVTALSQ